MTKLKLRGSYTVEAACLSGLFLLVIFASLFLTLILSFSFSKKLAHLIECLDIEHIWSITLPVSGFFLLFNIQCIPHSYETLHVNRVFSYS